MLSELRFSKMSFKRNKRLAEDDDLVLSSKALDDTELEKMIDAILESSRKATLCTNRKSERRKRVNISPTYTPADDPATDLNTFCDKVSPELLQEGEKTIIIQEQLAVNEREVRTPDSEGSTALQKRNTNETSCHLRRQRAVRRKTSKNEKCHKVRVKSVSGAGTTSPHTPLNEPSKHSSCIRKSIEDFAAMETHTYFGNNFECNKHHGPNGSKISYESTPGIETNDVQGSSTPTGASHTIQRCLMFSESPDSMENSLDKRKSFASSTTSRCSKSSFGVTLGTLDLSILFDSDKIQIHVIRCKDLNRQNGGDINAYVKVALLPSEPANVNGFQRTAVQRNSSKPFFDHRFVFDCSPMDRSSKRNQLAVWHRDREFKRSEFLGCMSFPIKSIVTVVLSDMMTQSSDEMITWNLTFSSFSVPVVFP